MGSGMMATCCIQPMDMIKVRIQLGAAGGGSTSPVAIASQMIKEEGFLSLYSGLSAGLTRQVVYTGARLGLFDFVKTQIQKMKPDPVTGEMPFKGPVDCAIKQVKMGGILRLWAGFPTYYFRIAPHAMITLFAQDQVKAVWKSMGV